MLEELFVALPYLASIAIFALVTSMSPGPNNLVLLTLGVQYGFKKSLGFLFGVPFGFFTMMVVVYLGLGAVFVKSELIHLIFKIAGGLVVLYMALKMIKSGAINRDKSQKSAQLGFLNGLIFQWINPKAWIMVVSFISSYIPIYWNNTMVFIAFILFSLCTLSCFFWLNLGEAIEKYLQNPIRLKIFNWSMAILLVLSVIQVLLID